VTLVLSVLAVLEAPAKGVRVRWVRCGAVVAAVRPAARIPAVTRAALREHDRVVRALAQRSEAALPVRFGTVAEDAAELVRQLRPVERELAAALARVRGREQMTLRVLGRPARVKARGGPGARYLKRRAAAMHAPELKPYRPALKRWVRAERVQRHDQGELVCSVYHLIDRGEAPRYLAALEGAGRQTRGVRGVRIIASGPHPAYAFGPEAWA